MNNLPVSRNQLPPFCFNNTSMDNINSEKSIQLNQQLISNSNINTHHNMAVCCNNNIVPNYQNEGQNFDFVQDKKSLSDILNTPTPKSKFNVIFDRLNLQINDLLEYKSNPEINNLLKHKIAQLIVDAYNDEKKKDSTLSDNMELTKFIVFINENFKCSESQLMSCIGTDFMKFFRSQIGSQYFSVAWSTIKKDYVVSVTKATSNCLSGVTPNTFGYTPSICNNEEQKSLPIFDEPLKRTSHTTFQTSTTSNYKFSGQLALFYSGMSNVLAPINNPLNQPKPTYYMDELDLPARCVMGKIMIYFCYYLALPRKEIPTSYFKENMTLFSGYDFNKDWYKLLFGKVTMAKMFSEIFYNEITCQSGLAGGAAIFCFISEQELWERIEENVIIYNSFGVQEINLNKLKAVKIQGSRYLFDAKNWIPMGSNAISLFGFNARGIYLN